MLFFATLLETLVDSNLLLTADFLVSFDQSIAVI